MNISTILRDLQVIHWINEVAAFKKGSTVISVSHSLGLIVLIKCHQRNTSRLAWRCIFLASIYPSFLPLLSPAPHTNNFTKFESVQKEQEMDGELYFMLKISRGCFLKGFNFSLSVRKSDYYIQLQAVLIELKVWFNLIQMANYSPIYPWKYM